MGKNEEYKRVYEAICKWFSNVCNKLTISDILLDVVPELMAVEHNEFYDSFTINELMMQYLLKSKRLSGKLDSDEYNHALYIITSYSVICNKIRHVGATKIHYAYAEEAVDYLDSNNLLVRFDLDKWNKIPNEDRTCIEIDANSLTAILDFMDRVMAYISTNKSLGDLLGGKCPFLFKEETIANVFNAMGITDLDFGFRTFASMHDKEKTGTKNILREILSKFKPTKKGK